MQASFDILMHIQNNNMLSVSVACLLSLYKRTWDNVGSTFGLQYAPCWLFDVATIRRIAWPQIALRISLPEAV